MGQLLDRFSFFDGLEMEPVTQVNWSDYWRGVIPDGVVAEVGEEMRPYANSTGMYVYVSTGACIVDNHRGVNSALKIMAVNTADATYDRIDLLVARVVYGNENESYMELDILTGTPAIDPVAPEITQSTGDVYEIALAEIHVAAEAVTLEASTVADLRNVFTAASQSISFINDDEVDLTKGMLVWLSRDNEGAVKRCPSGKAPIGVVTSDSIPVGSRGQVATVSGTIEEIACTEAAVVLGDLLIPSSTDGLAKAGGGYAGGLALEGKDAGAVGNVKSLLALLSKIPAQNKWYLPDGIEESQVLAVYKFVNADNEGTAMVNVNDGDVYQLTKSGDTVVWSAESGFLIPAAKNTGLDSSDLRSRRTEIAACAFGYSGLTTDNNKAAAVCCLYNYQTLMLLGFGTGSVYVNYPTINRNISTDDTYRTSNRKTYGVIAGEWEASAGRIYMDGELQALTNTTAYSRTAYDFYHKLIGQFDTNATFSQYYVTCAAFYKTILTAAQHAELAANIRSLGGIS